MAIDVIALQTIIGTDKKNPYLSILREKDSKHLHIYYGSNRLETVVDNPNHISFRTAAGRLYNAGLKRKVLSSLLGFDRRTLQSWGDALLHKSPQEALNILSGRRNRKMSPEIIQFARIRFLSIYPENHYSYSKQIRKEIEDVYQLSLCSESLRPLFNQWKQELLLETNTKGVSEENDTGSERQESCEFLKDTYVENDLNSSRFTVIDELDNRNAHVSNHRFIRHAGICIFASYITQIGTLFGTYGKIVKQWLCMILLEAVNIEQSKYLDFTSLSCLLGQTIRNPLTQRAQLDSLAGKHQCTKIFKLNADLCNIDQYSDFYYDPHTKHYTGISKTLKGWCPSIGHADKVLHSDFIHSPKGEPLFIMHCDNYYDLRERYQAVVKNFRLCVGIEASRCITLVLDRGIFSSSVFDSIRNDPNLEIITWEKGFKPCSDLWKTNQRGLFVLKKYRNSSKDTRLYLFKYIDIVWDTNPDIRRLVVQATNPAGKTIELGVLTTDKTRPAQEIIGLIFKRWIQENDFKYLDKHYGINQIISYDTIDYLKLKPLLHDKEVVSGSYKALRYEKMLQEKKLKDIIFKKHCHEEKVAQTLQRLRDIEIKLKKTSQERAVLHTKSIMLKERRCLKAKIARWNKISFDEKIEEYSLRLKELSLKLEANKNKTSKLDKLIDEGYQRLDVRKKMFMDVLKIYARNIFYHIFEMFRIEYDNFRDDHEYFRNITHADGVFRQTNQNIEIMLYPSAHLQPKIKNIIQKILNNLSQNKLKAIDDSGRKLTLSLFLQETLNVAIS